MLSFKLFLSGYYEQYSQPSSILRNPRHSVKAIKNHEAYFIPGVAFTSLIKELI